MANAARLTDIPSDIGEKYLPYKVTLRQRQSARKFCVESYINSVKIYRETETQLQIKACTFRSQKKTEEGYTTVLSINTESKSVTDAFCHCKAGTLGECAHVLAVLMKLSDWILDGLVDVPIQPSCTTLPQQWDRPRGPKILPEPVSTMVIAKPGNSSRKRKPLTAVFQDNRKIQLHNSDITFLQTLKDCPLSYLANTTAQCIDTDHGAQYVGSALAYQLPLLQPVEAIGIRSDCGNLILPLQAQLNIPELILNNADKWSTSAVSQDEAEILERNTRDQRQSDLWHKERESRFTASTFGKFMLRKSAVTDKFVNSLLTPRPFKSTATSYGINSEKVAINMYRKKTGNHVHECGLVVNPQYLFLGATPDGKVCENGQSGILEVKCPFSVRDWKLLDAIREHERRENFFLEEINDNISLKRNHEHWFQVQGQLLVTGAKFCDFVTYTKKDLNIERIFPDEYVMEEILSKLCVIYLTHVIKS